MCNEAVVRDAYILEYVPDYIMLQKICDEAIHKNPAAIFLVPACFKTQKMCIKALEVDPWQLNDIPDYFKTQEMCDDAVWEDPYSLRFVPDWFLTQQQLKIWHDDDYWYHDDEIIESYNDYQKRKAQQAKIEEELLPIAWHPDRMMDWCMSEDEKKRQKNCF